MLDSYELVHEVAFDSYILFLQQFLITLTRPISILLLIRIIIMMKMTMMMTITITRTLVTHHCDNDNDYHDNVDGEDIDDNNDNAKR